MVEQQEPGGKQTEGKSTVTNSPPAPHVESPPLHGKHEEGPAQHPAGQGQAKGKKTLDLLSRVSFNEWLTFFVGFGSLAVSFLAWRTASDSTDIKNAINNLSTLAAQTQRMADAQSRQINLLGQQVGEVRHQTAAIAEQTKAIKESSSAAVESANAQVLAANAAAQAAKDSANAQRPAVYLDEWLLEGFTRSVETDGPYKGSVKITINFKLRNTGGVPWEVVNTEYAVILGKSLPDSPDYSHATNMPGNGLTIAKGDYMHMINNGYIGLSKQTADSVVSGEANIFLYGIFTYSVFGTKHTYCFAVRAQIVDGRNSQAVSAGSPAYHCDN